MPIVLKVWLTALMIFALSGIGYAATDNKLLKKISMFSGGATIGMFITGIWNA